MTVDYHTHTNYSDGRIPELMIRAADDAGLEGIGFADHCNVSSDGWMQTVKRAWGFNLDLTYKRRREGLEALQKHTDLRLYDAVEIDYKPRDESAIEAFLAEAGFDYVVGSVHELDGTYVYAEMNFVEKSEAERERLVADYFDDLVALIDSELIDVAAHLDLTEQNPALRGYATEDQYHRVASALERSQTVPELNGGRASDDDGTTHPTPEFLDVLLGYDIAFVLGSDAHDPEDIAPSMRELERVIDERNVPTTELQV